MANAATAAREHAAATAATNKIRPAPPARVVALELDNLLYLCNHTPPRLPQPRQRGLRLIQQWFRRSRTHPHRFTSCLSHNTMVQTGRHPNELRLQFLVRHISMKFRSTSTSSLTQPSPSHVPTGPGAIQPNHPRTHLPPHHQYPEPRPPSFYDYRLHTRD